MKKFTVIFLFIILANNLFAQRIKDLGFLSGDNSEQIIGYGLVVGLSGSGDSQRSLFTIQSITNMLKRFDIVIPQAQLRTRNVAAVMVTASVNSRLKPGSKFDVNVSSMGDARSLLGGTLLMTPLTGGADGDVYAFAQGPISVGGYDFNTPTGARFAQNHTTAGRVPQGGSIKKEFATNQIAQQEVKVYLHDPDLTTANNIAVAINGAFGQTIAIAKDATEIDVQVPAARQNNIVGFLSELETIEVQKDYIAKVVLNERTGTVISGQNVKIQPVTISHGNLNIRIDSKPIISQPSPFTMNGSGQTKVVYDQVPFAFQDSTGTVAINGASNIQEVAAALNSLKVSPRDIIAIFQALKESGALIAELVII